MDNLGGYVARVTRIYKVLPGLAPHCTGSSYVPTQQGALWSVKQRQDCSRVVGRGLKRWLRLGVLVTLSEDPGLSPSTHMWLPVGTGDPKL